MRPGSGQEGCRRQKPTLPDSFKGIAFGQLVLKEFERTLHIEVECHKKSKPYLNFRKMAL